MLFDVVRIPSNRIVCSETKTLTSPPGFSALRINSTWRQARISASKVFLVRWWNCNVSCRLEHSEASVRIAKYCPSGLRSLGRNRFVAREYLVPKKLFTKEQEVFQFQPRNESVPCYLRVRPWPLAAYYDPREKRKTGRVTHTNSRAVSRLDWSGPSETTQHIAHR
jgi:hypothetical protein